MTIFGAAGKSNLFRAGCIKAALTVVIAAAGGHKYDWAAERKLLYSDAVKYSLFNSVGIIISSMTTTSVIPAILFTGGTLMFCVPSWYKCFTQKSDLHKLMPFGGMCMITSWLALALV